MADETSSSKVPLLGLDRPLPHNDEAEVAVLGAILMDPATALGPAASRLNFDGGFFRSAHRQIFATMMDLGEEGSGESIDVLTVAAALEKAGRLEAIGGRAYLNHLLGSVPTAANIEHYVELVRQSAVLRRLIAASVETVDKCFTADREVGELIDEVEQNILAVTGLNARTEIQHISRLVMPAVDYLDKLIKGEPEARGVQTGYKDLDDLLTGLRASEMIVVAARPSIGKTALALNMAANIALRPPHRSVGIFSLEMSAEQLVLRMLCSEARISIADMREGALAPSRWEEIGNAAERLRHATIVIDDTGGIDLIELRAKARRMHRDHHIEVLLIDYLQLIQTSAGRNATRENEVAKISGQIKALAKELEIPIVILAQLNRQAEQAGQRPKLSHLRESGAIEQDADVVALLHRDREEQAESGNPYTGMDAELIIAKHRNGPIGLVRFNFFPAYTRFESPSPIAEEDLPPL